MQEYCTEQVDTLWDEVKRFENPHRYYVDLSQKLWDMKNRLISRIFRLTVRLTFSAQFGYNNHICASRPDSRGRSAKVRARGKSEPHRAE